jgi:hypothetical protein
LTVPLSPGGPPRSRTSASYGRSEGMYAISASSAAAGAVKPTVRARAAAAVMPMGRMVSEGATVVSSEFCAPLMCVGIDLRKNTVIR